MSVRTSFSPPSEVAEYRMIRLLGRGAMGQVYLAHDTLLDRPVAIKFIAQEPNLALRERFLTEARAIARLAHPNVVSVYRVGEWAGRPYLVSEYVRGQSLADVKKPLPLSQVLRIALGLCAGLAVAHKSGVLHRDVKPANAMLSETGEAKLLDFGLAKLLTAPFLPETTGDANLPERAASHAPSADVTLDPVAPAETASGAARNPEAADVTFSAVDGPSPSARSPHPEAHEPASLTQTGALLGTPRYMAPERFSGQPATPYSDVYSMGALLFELACGQPPFAENDLAKLSAAAKEKPAPSLLPFLQQTQRAEAFSSVVERCLKKEPTDRFADGAALFSALSALSALPEDSEIETHKTNPPVSNSLRRRYVVLIGIPFLCLSVMGAVALTLRHGHNGQPDVLEHFIEKDLGVPAERPADFAVWDAALWSADLSVPDAAPPPRDFALPPLRRPAKVKPPQKTDGDHARPIQPASPPTVPPPTAIEIPIER